MEGMADKGMEVKISKDQMELGLVGMSNGESMSKSVRREQGRSRRNGIRSSKNSCQVGRSL